MAKASKPPSSDEWGGTDSRLAADMTVPPERRYCTYFNAAYEPRARVMVESLRASGEEAMVLVVCFDEESLRRTRDWDMGGVDARGIAELEERFPSLGPLRETRTPAEYFFTATPFVVLWALSESSPDEWVTYLDADLFFLSSPEPIYEELAGAHAGIIEHRFRDDHRFLERYGRFNVGWVSFRASDEGHGLARWWGDRCVEWCFDQPDQGRYADQGYLDSFIDVGSGVRVITHPGADLAPWNLDSHEVTRAAGGGVLVDGAPLIFFHQHGLKRVGRRYAMSHLRYGTTANDMVRDCVYAPYVKRLVAAERLWSKLPGAEARGRGTRGLGWPLARWRGWRSLRREIREGGAWSAPIIADAGRATSPRTSGDRSRA